jgi:hypothetical protein
MGTDLTEPNLGAVGVAGNEHTQLLTRPEWLITHD